MPWYPSDMNTLRWMATPLDKTRLRNPLCRGQPKRTSHEALSLVKWLFYIGPWKAWKYHMMTELHSVANHKRCSIVSLMPRRHFPPYKKFLSLLLFTWSHPAFCCSDISHASPFYLLDLSWKQLWSARTICPTSVWRSSLKTGKRPRLDRNETGKDQDQTRPRPEKTAKRPVLIDQPLWLRPV